MTRQPIPISTSWPLHPDTCTRTDRRTDNRQCISCRISLPLLTLPPTIAASRPPLHHEPPHFCVIPDVANAPCARPPETQSWKFIAAISSELPQPDSLARLSCRPTPPGRHR